MTEEKKKRMDLSLQEKQKILEIYDKLPKMSQRNAAAHLKISQPFLCKILKNRSNIEIAHISNKNMKRKRERSGKDNQVESALKIWFRKVREKNAPVNGPMMCRKAEELAKTLGKKGFVATDGWFSRWKMRENIVFKSLRGKEKSTDLIAANNWLSNEWPRITAEYSPQDIYNADETGLYFRAMPEHTFLFKNNPSKGFEELKEHVTVLCCISMVGEKRDLVVIGKSKNPQCFTGVKKFPVEYFANANAWMTREIFYNWLVRWDLELKRKIILLIDNCTAHTENFPLRNIKIVYVPSNTAFLIQPCEQGITQTLKAYYRRQIRNKILGELHYGNTCHANAIAKKISLLDALHLLAMSWKHVSRTTIVNCFRKGGFCKVNIEASFQDQSCPTDLDESVSDELTKGEVENWANIDDDIKVAPATTFSDIKEEEGSELFKVTEGSVHKDEEVLEAPPTDAEMKDALQILRRGVQYRATNFEKHYEYEFYIQGLLNSNRL